MRYAKPIDHELVTRLAPSAALMVTVEEGTTVGGAGSAVAEALSEAGLNVPLMHLGLPDRFMDHGDSALLLSSAGLDAKGIQMAVRSRLDAKA